MIACPTVTADNDWQARKERGLKRAGKGCRIIDIDGRRLDQIHRIAQPRQVCSRQPILRRHGRNRRAKAHGRIGDQGLINAVAREDQERRTTGQTKACQTSSQGLYRRRTLPIGMLGPALAIALGEP